MNISINGATALYGVVGWPVAHSLSPRLHNHWIAEAGLNAVYVPLPILPHQLLVSVTGLLQAGFRGLNVTIPHKQQIISVCTEVSHLAQTTGAVNTLYQDEAGNICGDNTDCAGFAAGLARIWPEWQQATARPLVVLGAGGAARAVLASLAKSAAPLRIVSRNREAALALAKALNVSVQWFAMTDLAVAVEDAALLVNATPWGQHDSKGYPDAVPALPADCIAYDLVYTPADTMFLRYCRAAGASIVINGLPMLVYQAQAAFTRWFGLIPDAEASLALLATE